MAAQLSPASRGVVAQPAKRHGGAAQVQDGDARVHPPLSRLPDASGVDEPSLARAQPNGAFAAVEHDPAALSGCERLVRVAKHEDAPFRSLGGEAGKLSVGLLAGLHVPLRIVQAPVGDHDAVRSPEDERKGREAIP